VLAPLFYSTNLPVNSFVVCDPCGADTTTTARPCRRSVRGSPPRLESGTNGRDATWDAGTDLEAQVSEPVPQLLSDAGKLWQQITLRSSATNCGLSFDTSTTSETMPLTTIVDAERHGKGRQGSSLLRDLHKSARSDGRFSLRQGHKYGRATIIACALDVTPASRSSSRLHVELRNLAREPAVLRGGLAG
jgi:hypothetical protein